MDPPFDRHKTPFPLVPAGLPGGKGARKAFLLSQGMLCFAKMLLAAHRSLLRITLGGAAAPPNHPGILRFPGIHCCSFFYENQYPCKQRGCCRLALRNIQTVDKIPLGCIEGPQSFDFKSAGPALPVRGAVIPLPLSIFGRKMSVSGHPCPEMPFYRKLMYPSKDCFSWLSMAGCRLCRHPEASP